MKVHAKTLLRNVPPQRGFSLIDVLIAAVVLSVGLLALAVLQGQLVRNSSATRSQTQAMALAQEKLEQYRAFKTATGATNSYASIVPIPSSSAETIATVGGTAAANTYTRTVGVERYILSMSTGKFVSADPTDLTTNPITPNEFKVVTVTVGWTDSFGTPSSTQIKDVISVASPTDSVNTLAASGNSHRGPQVYIDKSKFAPGVIPIAVGNNQAAAASDPQPETFSTGHITTRFSVQTYIDSSTSTQVLLTKQFDFASTSCTCNQSALSTTASPSYGPTYWNGAKYIKPVAVSGKPTGEDPVSKGNPNNSSQDPVLCNACCRDHHDMSDMSQTKVKFDPFRPANELDSSGDHKHYDTDNNNLLQTSAVTGEGGEYFETCRFVRVDGINFVSTDARQENHVVIAPVSPITIANTAVSCDPQGDTITSGTCYDHSLDSSTASTTYPNFVKDYVTAFYNSWKSATAAGNYPLMASAVTAGIGDLLVNSDGTPSTLATNYPSLINAAGGTTPQTTLSLSQGGIQYLEGRGVYIDYISDETKAALACIGQSSSACSAFTNSTVLQIIPFLAVNLTNLDSWRHTTAGTAIKVTNASIPSGGTYDPYVIGYTFDRGTVTAVGSGSDSAIAQARPGNAGLIDSLSVSPSYPFEAYNCTNTSTGASQSPCSADPPGSGYAYDTSSSNSPRFQTDRQPYNVTGSATTYSAFSVSWKDNSVTGSAKSNFNSGSIALTVTAPTTLPTSLQSCTIGKGNKQPYSCQSTSTDTSITIQFSGYNSQVSCTGKNCPTPPAINDYKLCSISGLPSTVTAAAYPFTVSSSGALNEQTSVTLTLAPGSGQTVANILSSLNITANFYGQSQACP